MSREGNHHYLPQFHLRKWEGGERTVVRWGRVPHNGKLVRRRVNTAATAYERGLYALEEVVPDDAQKVEREVFGKIEERAAPILDKLIAFGPDMLSVEDRYWWTMYLHAALLRVPHVVNRMKLDTLQLVRKNLSQNHAEFLAAKGNAPERTLLEWAENNSPGRIVNSGLKVMIDMLNNEKTIDRIIHLHWIVRLVHSSPRQLLIGDDPLGRVGDLFKPRCLISIPLSPTHAFFGSDAGDIVQRIVTLSDVQVVDASNVSALGAAKKFAYGEADPSYVDPFFLRQLVPSKVT